MRLSNSHHHKQLSPSQKSCQEVERYKVIRQASQQVYESLGKACTKHKEHQAHFCVEAKQVENGGEDCFQIRFNMAYTQRPGAPNQSELIWFVVDSTSGYIEKQGSSVLNTLSKDSIENSLKRQPDSMACTVQKKIRKSVRFQSPVRIPSYTPPIPSVAMASVYERIQKDFCDHLRRLRDRPQASECVGVLGNSANCKNLVYTYPIEQCHSHRQPFTLEQLISTGGQVRSNGRILLEDRVRLAKTLAVAVLQYYSTPWLKKSWRSEDIYFFTSSLTLPHLNVRVKGPCDQLSQAPMTPPHSLARNPLLFSLAVVLLEIAYKSKLDNLQSPVDLVDGPGYTEFFVARRLATSAETDMPGKYHKIVERLIECDFACGSDMEDPKLQAAFHNDVICPLEELEQGLHRLYLDQFEFLLPELPFLLAA